MLIAERSNFCVFTNVQRQPKDEMDTPATTIENISKMVNYPMVHVASLDDRNGFARENQ